MKQIKIFILALILALPALASAQSENTHQWKGFFDFSWGFASTGVGNFDHGMARLEPKMSFGVNFTEGYQFTDYLFAGVGFGAYTLGFHNEEYYYDYWDNYYEGRTFYPGIYAPIFADVRWTLDINRTINPFVDLKIGYQFAINIQDEGVSDGDSRGLLIRPKGGYYCLPTIGVRFGKRSGFNLGIGFNISTLTEDYGINNNPGSPHQEYPVRKKTSGTFVVTFGADF